MNDMDDDGFELHDLRVEVVGPPDARIFCGAKLGDSFELRGEPRCQVATVGGSGQEDDAFLGQERGQAGGPVRGCEPRRDPGAHLGRDTCQVGRGVGSALTDEQHIARVRSGLVREAAAEVVRRMTADPADVVAAARVLGIECPDLPSADEILAVGS